MFIPLLYVLTRIRRAIATNSYQNSNYFYNVLFIASSTIVAPQNKDQDVAGQTNYQISNAVRYTAASGAKVFATGSVQWVWGLDSDGVNPPRADDRARQIAVNILADMGAKPQTPAPNLVVPQ